MILTPSYSKLPEKFYEKLDAVDFSQYRILHWNDSLAQELGVTERLFHSPVQLAQAYAGHQFGHFVPQLGDGRARLVGEFKDPQGQLHEVHLKGSGPTQFSRRGDGLATLGAVLRELIVSEGMHFLKIPTTRTLAVLGTGKRVQREAEHPGAIQVRVAKSHVRVGTFEYFAARGDTQAIQMLADTMIARLYPQVASEKNKYIAFFESVVERQIQLVARWLQVGFIHGVMNTDNTTISGESIDYGPCAFMEEYDPLMVYSSIDHQGRYAYARQPQIIKWNLTVLGYCLLPLFAESQESATSIMENAIAKFESNFEKAWLSNMAQKLGIEDVKSEDVLLVEEFLMLLQKYKIDFTLGFRNLNQQGESKENDFKDWSTKWKLRILENKRTLEQTRISMDSVNPVLIPRNHLVEAAINAASQANNFVPLERLLAALKIPFADLAEFADLQKPAKPEERVSATFCGT